jgi:eukaryotic-like serine/threonine-protein kinase
MPTRGLADPDARAPDAQALRAGTRLGGRYLLERRIGAGGMGEVWEAKQSGDHGFAKKVAIKLIRGDYAASTAFRRMFLEEARVTARIQHANVVTVLDLGDADGVVYQAMAFVEGASLARLLRAKRPPRGVALRIVVDALRGLHAAHELRRDDGRPMNLVHRDVSPDNILVGVDGVAKIADFGVAKLPGGGTIAGEIKGKLSYLSPEQSRGLPLERRSDVFAMGIVLWELLTGARLFSHVLSRAEAPAAYARPIKDPTEVVSDLDARVVAIVMKALSEQRDARFETAEAMADAIEATGACASSRDVAVFVKSLVVEQADEQADDAAVDTTATSPSPSPSPDLGSSTMKMAPPVAGAVGFVTAPLPRAPRAPRAPIATAVPAPLPVPAPSAPQAGKMLIVAIAGIAILGTAVAFGLMKRRGPSPAPSTAPLPVVVSAAPAIASVEPAVEPIPPPIVASASAAPAPSGKRPAAAMGSAKKVDDSKPAFDNPY